MNLVLPKGDKGDKGEQGEQGIPGEKGADGQDGQNGQDGYTPVKGTDYFTEEEIQQIESNVLDKVNQFSVQVVQELPTKNIDDHTIYFVLKTNTEQNDVYDEYIYVNNDWEHIGTTAVDLSNYYNKEEVDNKIANIQALPVGGTTGQVLTKQSDTDGDASWQDSGDTLPVGTIVDYEGDTVPEGYVEVENEGEVYSTEEVRIGTWIDGKPLYRKVISVTLPSEALNSDYILTDLSSLNIKSLTKIEGIIDGESNQVIVNFAYQGNTQYGSFYYQKNSKILRYSTNNSQYVNVTANIILEYTKTTD